MPGKSPKAMSQRIHLSTTVLVRVEVFPDGEPSRFLTGELERRVVRNLASDSVHAGNWAPVLPTASLECIDQLCLELDAANG